MKKLPLFSLLVSAWFFTAGVLYAEDIYVTGITNITMRTGPGVDHKIVAMLKSGTKLQIIEFQADWSMVQTAAGKEGWVLSRFLTRKVPDALMVEELRNLNSGLQAQLKALEDENKDLTVKNATLVQVEEKYNKLKKESSDFLKLDNKYKKMVAQYEEQKAKIERLEDESKSELKFWFLIGPGVFIVGLFLGLSTRKKKKSSLL